VHRATLTIDPTFRIADVDPRLYGSLVEHMGRCVYTGIYEPGHPSADPDGFRGDVAELVRELGVTLFRYPGGNFVSGYNWEDGIGPADQRPTRLDLAWRSIEPNQVGVDEFLPWSARVGGETMMAVNLGSRGLDAARNLVEYCNYPSGTAWSDLRRRNGAADPYGVKVWCLGNEMDGPWQIGHKTAREYGRLAAVTANAMRRVDPSIELVACGSSNSQMPTFASWEATVLEEAYELVDYLALHHYFQPLDGDRDGFLAAGVAMDRFIDAAVATCDHARAVGRHNKRINLCFDEWNVWYQHEFAGEDNLEVAQTAPRLIEDTYSALDAVVVGNLLISLLRHADRVRIACLAQLVNVIAPIRTEPGGPAWRQTTFYPFMLTSRHGRGTVLRVEPRSPVHDTRSLGEVPLLDAAAVLEEESGTVALFLVNRDQQEPMGLELDVRALPELAVGQQVTLSDQDPDAVNSATAPDRVAPSQQDGLKVADGRVEVVLPPLSWNMLRLLPTDDEVRPPR
jgi:alpha-L-arabinofuranosidase